MKIEPFLRISLGYSRGGVWPINKGLWRPQNRVFPPPTAGISTRKPNAVLVHGEDYQRGFREILDKAFPSVSYNSTESAPLIPQACPGVLVAKSDGTTATQPSARALVLGFLMCALPVFVCMADIPRTAKYVDALKVMIEGRGIDPFVAQWNGIGHVGGARGVLSHI